MKPHSAVTRRPLKIPVSICWSAVLKGAGGTLLKAGELGSHLSRRISSFAVIYRNVFIHTKHTVLKTPWQGTRSVPGWDTSPLASNIYAGCLHSQQRDLGTLKGESTLSGGGR